MSEWVEIVWNAASIDEARGVCRYLVQERWVATANIVPWVESIYLRDGLLETSQESQVILKTERHFFEQIYQVICDNTSYEVPEVVMLPICEGGEEFLSLLRLGPEQHSYANDEES